MGRKFRSPIPLGAGARDWLLTLFLRRRPEIDRAVSSTLCLSLFLCLCFLPGLALASDRVGSGMVPWLLAPIDPSGAHDIDWATSWHGRLMVLVWAFLFPAGILAARFFKIMPGQDWPRELDNASWWHTHLATQYIGGVLLLMAFGLSMQATGTNQGTAAGWHRVLGWVVAFLAASQFIGGWLRGTKGGPTDPAPDGSLHGDHYDMTRRRRVFEYAHKTCGYLALLAAWITVMTGLYAANGPRWMWLGVLAWWVLIIGLAIWLQRQGWARDTYEAIWGPDNQHPGNHRRPIGFGVRRMRDRAAADRSD